MAKPGLRTGQRHYSTGLYIRSAVARKERDLRCERFVNRMYQIMGWLKPKDRPAARNFAQLEEMGDAAWLKLREEGFFNEDGNLKRLADDLRKIRALELAYMVRLGMTPSFDVKELPGEVLDLNAYRDGPDADPALAAENAPAGRRTRNDSWCVK